MSKWFYSKLVASNIKKNQKTYIPYILTCVFCVAMFYIINSLTNNEGISNLSGADSIRSILGLGTIVTGITSVLFLFYTNSFLMKQRKKEFGLFNILGMEKRHIGRMIALETCGIFVFSVATGLIIGIILDKLLYMIILRILGVEVALGFYISRNAIINTFICFFAIFFAIFLNSVRQVHLSNPIELLRSKNEGEKEPKTKGITAICGVICLGIGYYISLSTENPVAAFALIFVAVVFVIVGTFCLFQAGSIVLLKLLRKNKSYYYQTKHFTSVSGMIYRMKQNAAGLSNICILCTMVLVMISSTTSMVLGQRDILNTRYPNDIAVQTVASSEEQNKQIMEQVDGVLESNQADVEDRTYYTSISFSVVEKDGHFLTDEANVSSMITNMNILLFISLDDYNRISGSEKTLNQGEVLIYSNRDKYNHKQLSVLENTYQIKEVLEEFPENGELSANIANAHYIVLKDKETLRQIASKQQEVFEQPVSQVQFYYGVNLDESKEQQRKIGEAVTTECANNSSVTCYAEIRAAHEQDFKGVYGSFFFIGIFLSMIFLIITILIIYYKQISEGYDDRERYLIMQKVGMSQDEVKRSIRSQILTVFYLPLITAGIHVAFSLPFFSKILMLMNLMNTKLFVICTIVSFLIFAIVYSIIYTLTARVYYQIVSK